MPVSHRQLISANFFLWKCIDFLFPVIDTVFMTDLSGAIAAFSRLPLLFSCGLCLGIERSLELMVLCMLVISAELGNPGVQRLGQAVSSLFVPEPQGCPS